MMMKLSTILIMLLATAESYSFGEPSRYTISLLNGAANPRTMMTPFVRLLRETDRMMDQMMDRAFLPLTETSTMKQQQMQSHSMASPQENSMMTMMMPPAFVDSNVFAMTPRYQMMTKDEKEFKVVLDVPGVKESDVHVEYNKEMQMLTIKGSRENSGDGYSFSSRFQQSFTVDPKLVETDHFTAKLDEATGALMITAPKIVPTEPMEKEKDSMVRKIPVLTTKNNMAASTESTIMTAPETSANVTTSTEGSEKKDTTDDDDGVVIDMDAQ